MVGTMKIKVKLAIAIILVIGLGSLYSCKNKETEKKDSDNRIPSVETESNSKDDTQDESGLNIVEDEVTVDFGTEEHKTESGGKAQNTTAGNTSTSGHSVNKGQTDNDGAPSGGDTNSETNSGDTANKSEEPKNPYDKDGDGYVDGWY